MKNQVTNNQLSTIKRLFKEENKSIATISAAVKLSTKEISRIINEHKWIRNYENLDFLREFVKEKRSITDMSKVLNISRPTLQAKLEEFQFDVETNTFRGYEDDFEEEPIKEIDPYEIEELDEVIKQITINGTIDARGLSEEYREIVWKAMFEILNDPKFHGTTIVKDFKYPTFCSDYKLPKFRVDFYCPEFNFAFVYTGDKFRGENNINRRRQERIIHKFFEKGVIIHELSPMCDSDEFSIEHLIVIFRNILKQASKKRK